MLRKALVGALVCTVLAAMPASAAPMTDEATLAELVDYLEDQRVRLGIPGMAVAVVVDGDVVLAEGFGEASPGAGVAPDTPFLVNSLSKSIAAFSVMQLVGQGLVDLDAPVTRYIPELSPGADDVSITDLMHHRSGLTEYDEVATISTEHDTLEKTVLRLEPLFGVGDGFEYTNGNYDTLALVVERVSGVPYGEYVDRHVFEPLGMEDSMVGDAGRDLPGAAEGHYRYLLAGFLSHVEFRPGTELGSAKVWSSAADMGRYLTIHTADGVAESLGVSDDLLDVLHRGPALNELGLEYAGGLWFDPAGQETAPAGFVDFPTVYHTGDSSTFRSAMWASLGSGVGMVILTNGADPGHEWWVSDLAYYSKVVMSGEEPPDVENRGDAAGRAVRWVLLGLVGTQAVLAVATIAVLRRPGRPSNATGLVIGAATLVDLVVLALVLWGPRALAGVPFAGTRLLPDVRAMIWAGLAFVVWGVLRTILVLRRRSAVPTP